jgi:hypothetical protein
MQRYQSVKGAGCGVQSFVKFPVSIVGVWSVKLAALNTVEGKRCALPATPPKTVRAT